MGLVKDAQYLFKTIVDLAMQTGYLHKNAVMSQTVNERIGKPLGNQVVIIVVGMTTDIEHRFLNVTHLMT